MAQRDNILGIDAKRALITIVIAVILLVGAFSLIGKAASFDEIVEALEAANRQWFPICLAGLVCAYAGYIAGYREIARMHGGPNLPLGTVFRIVGIGFGANVLGSAAGGLAVDFWALRRAGASTHERRAASSASTRSNGRFSAPSRPSHRCSSSPGAARARLSE